MSRWPHERYHAEPVYDVHDCGTGTHDRYICGWDVVSSEGIYEAGPFDSEPEAAEEAQRLNSAARVEQEALCAGHQQHNAAISGAARRPLYPPVVQPVPKR